MFFHAELIIKANCQWIFIGTAAQRTISTRKKNQEKFVFLFLCKRNGKRRKLRAIFEVFTLICDALNFVLFDQNCIVNHCDIEQYTDVLDYISCLFQITLITAECK